MLKKLLIGLVVLVVVAGIGVYVLLLYADSLVRAGIEQASTQATGQKTTLASAHVAILSGSLTLDQLTISNPTGFDNPLIFRMGDAQAQVTLASLLEETIEIPLIRLEHIQLNLIRNNKGEQNLKVILDRLRSMADAGQKPGEPRTEPRTDAKPGKQFIIRKLVIDDVHIRIEGYGSKQQQFKLPPIVLENIGSTTGRGVVIQDLAGIVLREITKQMLENPQALPTMALGVLNQGLEGLGPLGEVGLVRVGKLNESVEQLLSGEGGDIRAAVGGKLGDEAGRLLNQLDPSASVRGLTESQRGDEDANPLRDLQNPLHNLLGGQQQPDSNSEQ